MLALGIGFLFAGYTVGTYGWVLLKGYDIPFRQWVSPLHPWQWPAAGGTIPPIPDTQLFPTSTSQPGSSGGPGGGTPPPPVTGPPPPVTPPIL